MPTRDATALSASTAWLPSAAISAPASTGPTMRDTFIAIAFIASAALGWLRGTSSGTSAANTGQRSGRPMPSAKVGTSGSVGFMLPASSTVQAMCPEAVA